MERNRRIGCGRAKIISVSILEAWAMSRAAKEVGFRNFGISRFPGETYHDDESGKVETLRDDVLRVRIGNSNQDLPEEFTLKLEKIKRSKRYRFYEKHPNIHYYLLDNLHARHKS